MFLHGIFSPVVTKILKIFDFSNFLKCGLIFHQNFLKIVEKIACSAWNSNLLHFFYDICNRSGNIRKTVFVFLIVHLYSARLIGRKNEFGTYTDL